MTAPRRLMLLFVLLLLVPASALVYLGMQLVRQERELEIKQQRDRLESAADRFANGLEQAVAATERRLDWNSATSLVGPADDALVLRVTGGPVEAVPATHLLYDPAAVAVERPTTRREFESAEAAEYQVRDYEKALSEYSRLSASSHDSSVRAEALLRRARTLRSLGRAREALTAYGDLARLRDTRIAGLPADLVARRARCELLHEAGDLPRLRDEARALRSDLLAVRWRLDEAAFHLYVSQTNQWLGITEPPADVRESLSAAAVWVWQQRSSDVLPAAGRRLFPHPQGDVVVLWKSGNEGVVALAAGPRYQQREWMQPADEQLERRSVCGLPLVRAHAIPAPSTPAAANTVIRRPADTRLPWTLSVTESKAAQDEPMTTRRRTMLAGLTLLIAMVFAGGYLISRAVSPRRAMTWSSNGRQTASAC